jgi:hypothetical protein
MKGVAMWKKGQVANGAVIAIESAVILRLATVGKPLLLCYYLHL